VARWCGEVLAAQTYERRFDVVHFAGHSLTTNDSLTLLVLPGEHPGEAEGMAVETFARGAADTGAKLVYLSSCKGSSANTVASLAQRSVPYGLGFRWMLTTRAPRSLLRYSTTKLFGQAVLQFATLFGRLAAAVYPPNRSKLHGSGFSDPSFAVRRLG